jgi:hypothetical protein
VSNAQTTGQLADERSDAVDLQPNIDTVNPDINALDQKANDARLFGWKKLIQSGSNACSASRTSDSTKPLMDLRALRHVWTMISGERSRKADLVDDDLLDLGSRNTSNQYFVLASTPRDLLVEIRDPRRQPPASGRFD